MPSCELDQPDRFSDLLEDIAGSVALIDGRPAGGALLAPRLVLLPAMEACADGQLVRLGTAVELLHRAALVHRQPQVEERRAVSGDTPISRTLQGDILLSQCYRLLAEHGAARTGAILSRAMAEVAEGELTGHAEGAPPSAERVQRTAALYEGAAATGALVADLPRAESAEYALWGRAVGVAHERSLSFGEAEGFCPPPASFAAEAHRVYAGVGKLDCLPQAA